MEFTYQMDRETAKKGASSHYDYRHRVLRFYRPILGCILIAIAGYFLLQKEGSSLTLPMLILGPYLLFAKKITICRSARRTFQGRPEELSIHFKASDSHLAISSNNGDEGSSPWESYIDWKPFEEGLLLYPQKDIYYWIPSNASFSSGSWPEFLKLVEIKVTRKI